MGGNIQQFAIGELTSALSTHYSLAMLQKIVTAHIITKGALTDGDGLRRCRCCSLPVNLKWRGSEVQHVCPKSLSNGSNCGGKPDISRDIAPYFRYLPS